MVGGVPAVTIATPYVVDGRPLQPPPAASGPCVTARWITASKCVTSNGQLLLLVDSQVVCAPTGMQTRVSAV
jgi:hypothetical protein